MIDFASWILALLAARRSAARVGLREDLAAGLLDALLDPEMRRLRDALAAFVRARVSAASVADLYVPALAERLGEMWMDDRASFAEVSLASARLQALLRDLGAAWSADASESGASAAVVVAIPPGEQHTLGAMVLAGQLRRLGISVRLLPEADAAALAPVLRDGGYAGVLISASASQKLDRMREFVEGLRRLAPLGLPVVVGGGWAQRFPGMAAAIGANAVTCDLGEALDVLGVLEPGQDARRRRQA